LRERKGDWRAGRGAEGGDAEREGQIPSRKSFPNSRDTKVKMTFYRREHL